jgi:hypothetical protein
MYEQEGGSVLLEFRLWEEMRTLQAAFSFHKTAEKAKTPAKAGTPTKSQLTSPHSTSGS